MDGRDLNGNQIELVTEYLDGAMDPRTAAEFEEHLGSCDGCRWYVEQSRVTIETTGAIPGSPLPAAAEAALLEHFRTFRRPG